MTNTNVSISEIVVYYDFTNVTGITLDKTSASMTVGGATLKLTPTFTPSNASDKTVTWTSSNTAVATVTNGVVTAVGAGTATITATATNGTAATSDDKTAKCTVTVSYVNVSGVTLSQTSASMTVGNALTLTATVAPNNASNKTVTWTSSNTAVATVTNGVVTAVAAGTATITATATNGTAATSDDKTATCTVTVSPVNVSGVTLSQTEAAMTVGGDALTLTATVAPDDATDKTVTWTTSDASVATVANGVVTAVAAGTATITATATNGTADTSDDKTATCEVTVAAPAPKYNLTKADGSEAHGTVAFTVGGNAATQAKKDDVVTVTVTPAEGYSTKDVTVRAYIGLESAGARGMRRAPELLDNITVTPGENGTWTFTMPEANVWVVVTYTKNLQDAWIQAIANQTYTGEAIEPTIEVKDGETTLTLNTDYTVAYSNNVEPGTATVTVTGTGNYSGTATATFIIRADKSDLNDAITAAEAYYNSIKDNHADAAKDLKTAIDAAKAVNGNADATQTDVNNALSALNTAKTTAEGNVLTETKTALNNDITAAEAYYESIKDGHTAAANTLKDAIDAAKGVKDNAGATQEQVDAAIAALAAAKTTAEGAVLTEAKTALNNAITEAEAYYNSISETNPDAAAVLQTAINAAKGVKNNADATQSEIETAAETLTDALNAAKADDALKRIAITIPAKSYVTRFDADKRQIETAVAGVSLYTVTGVTDKQVTLSAALNVVAAEMPYLIYNDNDEEKTINLIVSSSDADNVTVAAEFKGTLVDKTFTGEDMEKADHYVLSNGHNFVWVKDAGTLAGGKCWIELTKAAGARRLSIVAGGEATGIDLAPVLTEDEGAWYDLNGRRVVKPTKKGLYIKNGKKYVVK